MAKRAKVITPLPVLGFDTSKPGEYIAARGTTGGQNIRVRRSIIEKRPGVEALGDPLGERVQALLELDDGANTHFVRIGTSKVEVLNKSTLIWSSIASAPLTGDETNQISSAFPVLAGRRILTFTNEEDVIRKYTGSGNDAALGGSPPRAKFMIFFGGYLVLVNITDGGNHFGWRVQWPDTGDPETWGSGNAGSQELLEDSLDATGVGYFGQYFTIHKETSIYIGYLTNDTSIFRFERRDTGAGTVAHKTIITLPTGEQFFLARDGFRLFNGNTAPLVESPINQDIRDYLNPEHAYKSWAKIVRELDEVWCGVPIGSDTEPSTIYKFNYVTRQMHVDKRSNVTAVGEYLNTTGQTTWDELTTTWDGWVGPWDDIQLRSLNPVVCFGDSDGITTRQIVGSSDNGEAIEAIWDSKGFTSDDLGYDPGMLVEWQGSHIWARGSGSLEVYTSIDGGSSWVLAESIVLSSDYPADTNPQMVYYDRLSAQCKIRLRHIGNAQTFQLKQFAMIGVPREESDF